MNPHPIPSRIASLLAIIALCSWSPVSATNVGTGLISQLTYLGTSSQPDRIPLSPAIYNANYDYGAHSAIFESRPCFHGHFLGDTRPEYEQNLAVLYGISCELSDSTLLPGSIATFSLDKIQPPKAAPYTQEQVFAATLQTLLIHAGGLTKASPLTVIIKGDGMPKPDWAAKYEHPYFHPEKNPAKPENAEREHITVPGISIDESSVPGVTYLVIDHDRPTYHIRIEGGEMTPEELSAFVFSCIATVRPTEERPLELVLSRVTLSDEYRKKLKDDPAWKDGSSCQFTLEPKSMKLLKGSVPGYQMNYNPKGSTLRIKKE